MTHSFYFSPSGTTAKIANCFTKCIGNPTAVHNLTTKGEDSIVLSAAEDLAVFAAPVYAGRIPPLAAGRLKCVSGKGQNAVVMVVYGNRDYDDALAELCDIAVERGFNVVGAGAFIAEHCIFPKVASNRPDASDMAKIADFAELIRLKISNNNTSFSTASVKGNRPYKKIAGVPLHPSVNKRVCNSCGTCALQCPTGAIDINNPTATDSSKCITCSRCIKVCPQNARYFGGLLYKVAGWKFVKDNSRRLEPEWFV